MGRENLLKKHKEELKAYQGIQSQLTEQIMHAKKKESEAIK